MAVSHFTGILWSSSMISADHHTESKIWIMFAFLKFPRFALLTQTIDLGYAVIFTTGIIARFFLDIFFWDRVFVVSLF